MCRCCTISSRSPQVGAARVQAVHVGTHGLTIRHKESGGLLLPIVAVENQWDAETFLQHVCRKAGLPATAWQDDEAKLQTFEAVLIEGRIDSDLWADTRGKSLRSSCPETSQRLAEHCRSNVIGWSRARRRTTTCRPVPTPMCRAWPYR